MRLGTHENLLLTVAPNGDMFFCEDFYIQKSIIWKSSDDGESWNQVYINTTNPQKLRAITFDSKGTVYVALDTRGYTHVTKSEDNGNTWVPFNKPVYHSGLGETKYVVCDKENNVYILIANGGDYGFHTWEVYRSNKDGSFDLLDQFSKHPYGIHMPISMFIDTKGALYVTGWYKEPKDSGYYPERGITRVSYDKGQHWETIDDYIYSERGSKFPTTFHSITVDAFGNLYTGGTGKDVSFVRKYKSHH